MAQQANPISVYRPLQWQIHPLLDTSFTLLLTGSAGGGKALSLETLIPTPAGLRPMGDIQVGDFVYTLDLTLTKVVATSPVYTDHPCYKIRFENGQDVVCDAGHLWFIRFARNTTDVILATEDLLKVQGDFFVRYVSPLWGIREQKILNITPCDPVPVKCIQVEAKSGEFLITSDCIVTHNSRLAAEKVHAYLKKYPGTMGLMVRKQRQSMTNSTVLFFERTIVGPDPSVKHFPSKLRFEYDNGSILAYGGMDGDEQKEQIRSIGQEGSLHIVWMEEANRFTEEDFNEIMARMRGAGVPWIQIILSTNPDAPTHWIYRRLILKKEASVYYSKAIDNPHNPPSYVSILKKMTGVTKLRLSDGKWVQAEGVVYEEFDSDIHVIDPFEIPRSWTRFLVIDFGFTAPFVALWFAYSESNDRLYCYREIYMSRRTVRKHAEKMRDLCGDEEYEAIICDWDAEDRLTLEEEGFPNIEAYKDIDRGIQLVKERLKVREDGKPGLMFFRNMLVEVDEDLQNGNKPITTIEEFNAYVWAKSADGTIKDVPKNKDDHGCFIAGTEITTLRGNVPIEEVVVGDKVLTRDGYRTVLKSWQTNPSAKVAIVTFSDGASLTGTLEHPIYVEGRGYIELRALRYFDSVRTVYSVPVYVLHVQEQDDLVPVYNLTIDNTIGEYFANGVLVHNCDATRYAVAYLDTGMGSGADFALGLLEEAEYA